MQMYCAYIAVSVVRGIVASKCIVLLLLMSARDLQEELHMCSARKTLRHKSAD